MLSRMKNYINATLYDEKGNLLNEQQYQTLYNSYGYKEIGLICRFRDGRLHDNGDQSAVEFQDAHIEHFNNGFLHNGERNENGGLQPAIIANFGKDVEYWFHGKQVDVNNKPI